MLTIVRLTRDPAVEIGPVYEAVSVFADQGTRHFQQMPGRPSLFEQLATELERWRVVAVVCDASGVGQGITDALAKRMPGRVFPFDFAKAYGKSRLGNDFLSVVETGRFRYFSGSENEELSAWWWFFRQAEHCGYELAEGVPIERGLRWGVSPAAKLVTSAGQVLPVHDDRLLSAALVAEVDRLVRVGDIFLATGESAVIRGPKEKEGW